MRHLIGVATLALCALVLAPAARAVPLTFTASLDGPSENPPNASPGTGDVTVVYDNVLHTLTIHAEWEDLIGTTTVAHIHCCIAPPGAVGVAVTPTTLPGFPVGLTAGTYDTPAPIDLTDAASYTATFLAANGGTTAGAEAGLVAGMLDGFAYFNIHSTFAPGGEIRGFLQVVPEPATTALFALAAASVAFRKRRRSKPTR
jgi:hypothetical protein